LVELGGRDFEGWYAAEHPRLVASLVLVTGDVDLAVEAVDEACLRALMRWDRVAMMASPGGYVYRIALHEAWRRRRRAELEWKLLRRRSREAFVSGPAGEVWLLVRELSRRQREVLVLRYVADLTEVEIARVIGVSRGTVSSTLTDARRALRLLLEDGCVDEEDRRG
jgi:DNA-directed RNA polymerase specialized sigma24 family protein